MYRFLCSIGPLAIALSIVSLSFAQIDPGSVEDGHVWLFEDIGGDAVEDSSQNDLSGTVSGGPELVDGLVGKALKLDGEDDHVNIPNAPTINTAGPYANRTIKAIFNCDDVSISDRKQMIYEEGGDGRGANVYVFDGAVYVAKWEEGGGVGEWPSTPIESGTWYEVAMVLRDATDAVEDDKLELWLNGELMQTAPAGHLLEHPGFIAIGMINDGTVFPDTGATGASNEHFFQGLIDEVWVLNVALTEAELSSGVTSVEPMDKLARTWGEIKNSR